MNTEVDDYIEKATKWQDELKSLRDLLLDMKLEEGWKWKQPCYHFQDNNIVILGSLKDCCILSFFKGSLLKDPKSILTKPGKNTQSARYMKFQSVSEIAKLKTTIKSYIAEAIAIEKAGLKVNFSVNKKLELVEELVLAMKENPELKIAFDALTLGRQRGYNLFISSAKQSKTRLVRVEKNIPKILKGFGIHDCTCGLSKRMPSCDGSHKQLS